jgi:hypothetical protein
MTEGFAIVGRSWRAHRDGIDCLLSSRHLITPPRSGNELAPAQSIDGYAGIQSLAKSSKHQLRPCLQ